jgi:hypothetical protein
MRSQLTVRMPDDLRAELEVAAERRGHSLSDQLIWRLRASFARERDQDHDRASRAFAFLISRIAEMASVDLPERMPEEGMPEGWFRDPFKFRVFKLGVAKVLDAFDPPGEPRSPFANPPRNLHSSIMALADFYKTPEDAAEFAAASVLRELFQPDVLLQHRGLEKDIEKRLADFAGFDESFFAELERDYYAMSNARRDLQITSGPKKKGG